MCGTECILPPKGMSTATARMQAADRSRIGRRGSSFPAVACIRVEHEGGDDKAYFTAFDTYLVDCLHMPAVVRMKVVVKARVAAASTTTSSGWCGALAAMR